MNCEVAADPIVRADSIGGSRRPRETITNGEAFPDRDPAREPHVQESSPTALPASGSSVKLSALSPLVSLSRVRIDLDGE